MRNLITGLTIFSLSISTALACTDFRLTAKDGTELITRSMEFAMPMNSDIVSIPIGTTFTSQAPDGKPSMLWTSKYGYVGLNGFKQPMTIDGMNDQGLAFEYLYLPGYTQYQAVPAGKNSQAIPYFNFGDWVLGNFKSVEEVRQALANVYVYEKTLPALGTMTFPVHAAIHDASGKGVVVEFVNGKMQVNDYMGVMTNSPTYEWHVKHLPQYVNLSPNNPKPIIVSGVPYGADGEGAGMLGMPGDISPASRFVKMAYMLQYSYPADNAANVLNLAQHIINTVDIPNGTVRTVSNGKDNADLTQWVVFKDLTHKILYYRSYEDMTMRSIDLSKIDLTEKAQQLTMPVSSQPAVMDVTSTFNAAATEALAKKS